jgi:hypothetical protein
MRKSNFPTLTIAISILGLLNVLIIGSFFLFIQFHPLTVLGYTLYGVGCGYLLKLGVKLSREFQSEVLLKIRRTALATIGASVLVLIGISLTDGKFTLGNLMSAMPFAPTMALLTFILWSFSYYDVPETVRTRAKRTLFLALLAIVVSFTNHSIMYTYQGNTLTEKQIWYHSSYQALPLGASSYEQMYWLYLVFAVILFFVTTLLNVIRWKWMLRVVDVAFGLLGVLGIWISFVYPLLSPVEKIFHCLILAIPVVGYFGLNWRDKKQEAKVDGNREL